jgi:hypothetical protein
VLATSAVGLSRAKNVTNTVDSIGCSVSITFDDVLHGSSDGDDHYFMGISTLSNAANTFQLQLPNFLNQITSLLGNPRLNDTFIQVNDDMNAIIPIGTVFGYQSPFNSPLSSGSI